MRKGICWIACVTAISFVLCGCGGSGSSSNGDSGAPPQTSTDQGSNTSSNTLAGKMFQFTVTMSLNFSEPLGAVYTVDFHTDGSYTFHPSPQNRESQYPENGTY